MSENPKKRPLDESDIASQYEDPNELVNAVISVLQTPETRTSVAETYANDKNQATEIQAYAKIAGKDWTYYVKSLTIGIGRNTDNQPNTKDTTVEIDLGPAKVVSRQHASIVYNLTTRVWELHVLGRNGAKVDGTKVSCGPDSSATPLYSGCVIDIGGTQMMFILPDATPRISRSVLDLIGSKLPKPKVKRVASVSGAQPETQATGANGNETGTPNGYYYPAPAQNNLKAFQMFDNVSEQLKNSDSTAATNQTNTQNDLAKDEAKDIKPPYSYATMITQAILSNPEGVLSLSQIYEWISKQYAFYRFSKSGWQNSIRHNLSLNKAFEKVPRRANEPGKGMKWQIAESYKSDFLKKVQNGSLAKVRRGSSVSRQLQLHLAQHNDLPSAAANQQRAQQEQIQQIQKFQQEFQLHTSEPNTQYMGSAQPQPPVSYGQPYPNMQVYGASSMYPPPQLPPLKQSQQPQSQPQQGFAPAPPQQQPRHFPVAGPQGQAPHSGIYDSRNSSAPQYSQLPQKHQYEQVPPQQPPQPQSGEHTSAPPSQDTRPDTQESASTDRTELKPLSSSSNIKTTIQTQPSQTTQDALIRDPSPKKDSVTTPPKKSFTPLYQGSYNNGNGNHTATASNEGTSTIGISSADQTTKPIDSPNLEFGMITSPTKSFTVSAVEAYTPERGTRKKDDKQTGGQRERQRGNNLQSSPALWNFVQFSTPLGPNQGNKDDGEQKSPTKNGGFLPESPLNMKNEKKSNGEKNLGDLKDVDLAKGFQK